MYYSCTPEYIYFSVYLLNVEVTGKTAEKQKVGLEEGAMHGDTVPESSVRHLHSKLQYPSLGWTLCNFPLYYNNAREANAKNVSTSWIIDILFMKVHLYK